MELNPLKIRLDSTPPNDITNEEVGKAIEFEVENWDSKNLNIQQMIQFNLFTMDATQATIVKYLTEHMEVCTIEEFGFSVNRKVLENLRNARHEIEVALLQKSMQISPADIDKFGKL